MILTAWLTTGLIFALIARYCLVEGREPLTWGGLIVCCICSLGGPMNILVAGTWGLCWASDSSSMSRGGSWWQRPIFPRDDD